MQFSNFMDTVTAKSWGAILVRAAVLAFAAAAILSVNGGGSFSADSAHAQVVTATPTPRPDVDGLLATHSCPVDIRSLAVGQSATCNVRVQNRNEEDVTNVTSFVFNRKGYDVPTLPQDIVNIRIYAANGVRLDPVAEAAAIDGDTADIPANGYAVYETTFTKTDANQSIYRNRYACAIDDGVVETAYCTQGNNS